MNRVAIERAIIVPTPVGVNRAWCSMSAALSHCPHARGGEPGQPRLSIGEEALSPRPWG